MNNPKKQRSLIKLVVWAWMVALLVSNLVVGGVSFSLYRNHLLKTRGEEAMNVAISMAVRIDGDKFSEIMETLEKNDYWYEVKDYADRIAVVFDTAFIYILDANYTDEVTYFAEGAPDDAPFDLGITEVIADVYDDKMFETIATGEPSVTDPYPSGEYGDMVSGFAAITDSKGAVVGVVGVDFYYGDIQSHINTFAFSIFGIILAFLIFLYFVMFYLGNKLAGKPLAELDSVAQKLSTGDMSVSFDIKSQTEIGRLADSFASVIESMKTQAAALELVSHGDLTPRVRPRGDKDTMGIAVMQILENLNNMFNDIHLSAVQVSSGARQISDSAQSLANGASEQSSSVEKLSYSISEVTAKANENLVVADKANKLADSIKSDAQVSSGHMDRMTLAVKDIADASVSINKVIKVIDDIAFQTNILALNAAVEAARAGQHGKGFAVVAEEVRNLAAKSAEAAKDTEQLISDSMEKAQLGAAIADETAASLGRIIDGINECATLVDGIARSFDEQIKSMSEINDGIGQVSQVVQQNSATSEESAAASEQMSNQSDKLEELISQFKLRKHG